jgi:hypothetical protein
MNSSPVTGSLSPLGSVPAARTNVIGLLEPRPVLSVDPVGAEIINRLAVASTAGRCPQPEPFLNSQGITA